MMTDNEFQADSPISYAFEEGEISSGAASPATIVETHTMDTGVQTTSQPQSTESSRPQSPASSQPRNLAVHIDNPADKPVKHTSLSEKRTGSRCPTDQEQEEWNAVKATIPHITPNLLYNALACPLGQNEDFLKAFTAFKNLKNYPKQTNII